MEELTIADADGDEVHFVGGRLTVEVVPDLSGFADKIAEHLEGIAASIRKGV